MKKYLIIWKLNYDIHFEFYEDEKILNERIVSIESHCFNYIHEINIYELFKGKKWVN